MQVDYKKIELLEKNVQVVFGYHMTKGHFCADISTEQQQVRYVMFFIH